MKKYILFLMLSLIMPFRSLYAEQKTEIASNTESVEQKVTLYVKEMHCQLCVYLVNKELRAVDGVISTKADMKARKVEIVAEPKVKMEQLIQAVEKLEYSATML